MGSEMCIRDRLNALNLIDYNNRLPEFFELMQFGVKHKYFIDNEIMNPVHFNNIVHVACKQNEIKWAQDFVETHLQYITFNPTELQNAKILYTCQIDFARGNFSAARRKRDQRNTGPLQVHVYYCTIDQRGFGWLWWSNDNSFSSTFLM